MSTVKTTNEKDRDVIDVFRYSANPSMWVCKVGAALDSPLKPCRVFNIRPETAEMFPDISDPLTSPLPPRVTGWDAKERSVEWVLHNFSDGTLAFLWRTMRDGRNFGKMTAHAIDEMIAKEKKA